MSFDGLNIFLDNSNGIMYVSVIKETKLLLENVLGKDWLKLANNDLRNDFVCTSAHGNKTIVLKPLEVI